MENQKQKLDEVGTGFRLTDGQLKKNRKKWRKNLWWLLTAGLIILGGYFLFFYQNGVAYEFVKAEKMDLREQVEITGNVEANATITLSFQASGQVKEILKDIGQPVKKGDVIAVLDNADEELALKRAKANLDAQSANLNQKNAGATKEQIRIAEAQVQSAKASADAVSVDIANKKTEIELMKQKYAEDEKLAQLRIDDAKQKLDFASASQGNVTNVDEQALINAKSDLGAQLFSTSSALQQSMVNLESILENDGSSVLGSDYNRLDPYLLNDIILEYYDISRSFKTFYDELKLADNLQVDELRDFSFELDLLVTRTLAVQKTMTDMLTNYVDSSTISETQITSLKNMVLADSNLLSASKSALALKTQNLAATELGNVSSGDQSSNNIAVAQNVYDQQLQAMEQLKIDHQLDVNARQSAILSGEANLQVQNAAIISAEANLAEVKSPPRPVDVAFLRAQVAAAQIEVAMRQEDFEKSKLTAPTNGVVSRRNIEVGEDVSVSLQREVAFEMISADKFKIDADIAEVDIGKLKLGDKVDVVLDAIGEDARFEGMINKIDPVETLIQDVVYYKAEILIESTDERIKPGMTANLVIVLNEKNGVVAVPDRAVSSRADGSRFVRKLLDSKVVEVNVETGLRDLQGNLEIVSGIEENEEIILRTVSK